MSEVKNVARQFLRQQLRDKIAYARDHGLRFDLYVRPSTELSGPLTAADLDPLVDAEPVGAASDATDTPAN